MAERTERLRELLPEAFREGRVDFENLRAALGDLVDDRPERYSFSWAGKRNAIRLLQTPSRATLIPCRDESVNFDSTQHLFIEGDNLEVLKLLHKSYAGRAKMVYIDPPYNTGHDFIYPDNFTDPSRKRSKAPCPASITAWLPVQASCQAATCEPFSMDLIAEDFHGRLPARPVPQGAD